MPTRTGIKLSATAISGSTEARPILRRRAAVPVNVPGEASGIGDDCAHFVSSVLGTPDAGGLTIPSRAGTYGEPGAARLDELLVGNSSGGYGTTYQYGKLVTSVSQLTPGDVIGYDWDGSGGGSMSGIDHTVIYIGNNLVDCHATSHLGANWTLGGADDYFFIHITLPDSIVPTAPSNVSPAANTSVTEPHANAHRQQPLATARSEARTSPPNGRSSMCRGATVYDSGTDTTAPDLVDRPRRQAPRRNAPTHGKFATRTTTATGAAIRRRRRYPSSHPSPRRLQQQWRRRCGRLRGVAEQSGYAVCAAQRCHRRQDRPGAVRSVAGALRPNRQY